MKRIVAGKKKTTNLTSAFSVFLRLCARLFYLLPATCYLLLASCPNSPQVPQGKGAFTLNIAGLQRTILFKENLSLDDIALYTLAFENSEFQLDPNKNFTVEIPAADIYTTPVYLDAGTYSLIVNAYLDTAKNKYVASGDADFSITAGQKLTQSITLSVISAGTGTFSWDLTLPASMSYGDMDVTNHSSGSSVCYVPFALGDTRVTDTDNSIPSGYYSVLVTLSKTGASDIKRREILHIYNSMISHYEYTFLDAHFNMNIHTVIFDFDGADGVSVPMQQSCFYGEVLHRPADPKRAGYAFKGWFIDPDFSGSEYPFTSPVTGNFNLYAKWLPEQVFNPPTLDMADKRPQLTINSVSITTDGEIKTVTVNTPVQIEITNRGTGASQVDGTNIEWKLNNAVISGTNNTTTTHTYTPSKPGMDLLTVRWQVGTVWYSTSVWIRVEEG